MPRAGAGSRDECLQHQNREVVCGFEGQDLRGTHAGNPALGHLLQACVLAAQAGDSTAECALGERDRAARRVQRLKDHRATVPSSAEPDHDRVDPGDGVPDDIDDAGLDDTGPALRADDDAGDGDQAQQSAGLGTGQQPQGKPSSLTLVDPADRPGCARSVGGHQQHRPAQVREDEELLALGPAAANTPADAEHDRLGPDRAQSFHECVDGSVHQSAPTLRSGHSLSHAAAQSSPMRASCATSASAAALRAPS